MWKRLDMLTLSSFLPVSEIISDYDLSWYITALERKLHSWYFRKHFSSLTSVCSTVVTGMRGVTFSLLETGFWILQSTGSRWRMFTLHTSPAVPVGTCSMCINSVLLFSVSWSEFTVWGPLRQKNCSAMCVWLHSAGVACPAKCWVFSSPSQLWVFPLVERLKTRFPWPKLCLGLCAWRPGVKMEGNKR